MIDALTFTQRPLESKTIVSLLEQEIILETGVAFCQNQIEKKPCTTSRN
jgi:hypothetical protein